MTPKEASIVPVGANEGPEPTTRPRTAEQAKEEKAAAKSNRAKAKEVPAVVAPVDMDEQRQKRIAAMIKKELCILVSNHIGQILEAYDSSIEDHDTDLKFSFPVGFAVKITGEDPEHYKVQAKIRYNVKFTEEIEDQVRIGTDMVDLMDAAEGDQEPETIEQPDLVVDLDAAAEAKATGLENLPSPDVQAIIDNPDASEAEKADARRELETRGGKKPMEPEPAKRGRK
jgi:hypothetical protein